MRTNNIQPRICSPWKLSPVLGSPIPVLGVKIKQEKDVIWLFSKINLSKTTSMGRSHRELSIDFSCDRDMFLNNQITLFPCYRFIPIKQIRDLLKQGILFLCRVRFTSVMTG